MIKINSHVNEIREIVQSCWADVLQVDTFENNENFYVLGGDSLKFAEMYSSLCKTLNLDIPMIDLLEHKTVDEIVHYLQTTHFSQKGFKYLRALIDRNHHQSVIFLHNPYGTSVSYKDLALEIKTHRNVYGVDFNIAESDWSFPLDKDRILDDYIKEILDLQPQGPYFFAGDSMGGKLALELARKLNAIGHEIGSVFLLDTVFVETPIQKKRMLSSRMSRYFGFLINHLSDIKKLSFKESIQLTSQKFKGMKRRRALQIDNFQSVENELNKKIESGIFSFTPGEMFALSRRVFKIEIEAFYNFSCVYLLAVRSSNLSSFQYIQNKFLSLNLERVNCMHGEFISRATIETARIFEKYLGEADGCV